MRKTLKPVKLYGDDFDAKQIKIWYDNEAEAYANLGNLDRSNYHYHYHQLNKYYGFSKIKKKSFQSVLGFGSAWGDEFLPIISKIRNITIVESSDNLRSEKIGQIFPRYIKPNPEGILSFENNTFDLVTCFDVLHHIPNVTLVLSELIRVLQPGGFLILREPIVSMGDWSRPRKGLTKNERGIPVKIFGNLFMERNVEIILKRYYSTMTYSFDTLFRKFLKKPIYAYKFYLVFDMIISLLLKWNVHYFPKNILQKISPSSIFYVIKKKNNNHFYKFV